VRQLPRGRWRPGGARCRVVIVRLLRPRRSSRRKVAAREEGTVTKWEELQRTGPTAGSVNF